jgi:hypothetical protein
MPARLAASNSTFALTSACAKVKMRRLVEPNPVGVDQDVEAAERLFEQVRPREIIGKRLDGFAKRISTVR